MRAAWAIALLEWRRLWLLPAVAVAAATIAFSWAGHDRLWPAVIAYVCGAAAAVNIAGRLHGPSAQFLFARPVHGSAVLGGAVGAAVSLALVTYAAALLPLVYVEQRVPTLLAVSGVLIFVSIVTWAFVVGLVAKGLASGSGLTALAMVVIVALSFGVWRAGEYEEWASALPLWGRNARNTVPLAFAALSVAIGLGSVAVGVARGRGRVDPTMVSAWRTFGLGTAVVAIVAALWVADVRTAPPDRLLSIRFVRPGPDQTWALVSGPVREATGYMPSFLVHPVSGEYERLEGLSPLSASTFSADGRVFAAVAGWRRPRANRVMVRGLTADGGIAWRAEREFRGEHLPRIALSASGRVLAIRTATELSVFDSRTLSPGVRLSQTHPMWRAMRFRDDRVLVTGRDVVSSTNGRETEIVTVDTETGGVTVVARYRSNRDHVAILDPTAHHLLLIDPSSVSQKLRMFDLLSGAESVPMEVDKARILPSTFVLPDGRIVALVRHDAGVMEIQAVGTAAALTLPDQPWSVQWLGGNLVALGFRGQRDVADGDYTLIADVAAGRFTGRETGLLPLAGLHWDSRAGGASTLFVKHRREVVNRPDLAARPSTDPNAR